MRKHYRFWPDSIGYFCFHFLVAVLAVAALYFAWAKIGSPGLGITLFLLLAAVIVLGRYYSTVCIDGKNIWGPPTGSVDAVFGPGPISVQSGLIRIELSQCRSIHKKNGLEVKGTNGLEGFVIFMPSWKFKNNTLETIKDLLNEYSESPNG